MSSVIIPIRSQTATAPTGSNKGLLIPFGLGGLTASRPQQREQEVLKAVAAAVAVSHTAESLTLAREAQREGEDPGARFAAIVATDLRVVLDEVVRVQGNRAGTADEEQRVVAAAVSADPVLVAAAHAKVSGNQAVAKAAREWVASVDAPLLERAARAGARREFLNPGQLPESDLTKILARIEVIEKRLPAEGQIQSILDRLDALDKRLAHAEGTSGKR